MTRKSALILCLVYGVTSAFGQAPDLSKLDVVERSVPDGPVAMVSGVSVGKDDFLFLYRQQIAAISVLQPNKPIPDSVRAMTGIRCLAELVQREIMAQEADRLGLKISEDAVQKAYQEEVAELRAAIKEQNQVELTEEQILAQGNQTREHALNELRKEMKVVEVREHIAKQKSIQVTDAEIEKFYSGNPETFNRAGGIHIKQIFVNPKPNAAEASDAAWKKAEEEVTKALGRLKAGETFEGVAKAVSQAPDAKNGGDLGMKPSTALPAFFVEAAQKLQPGEVSGVFRSKHGVHAIKLVAKEGESTVPIEEARERIKGLLLKQKLDVAVDEYTEPMLNDPDRVRLFIDLEDKLAALPQPAEAGMPQGQ